MLVKEIVAGGDFVFFITGDNKVWGKYDLIDDESFEPGKGLFEVKLPTGKTLEKIVAGSKYSFFIFSDRTVYVWGLNRVGQLGVKARLGLFNFDALKGGLVEVKLPIGKRLKEIVAGFSQSFFIFEDGAIYACGSNVYGQLGIKDHAIHTGGDLVLVPKIPRGKKLKKLVLSEYKSYLLYDDGEVYAAGSKYDKRAIGKSSYNSQFTFLTKNIVEIFAGPWFAFLVSKIGEIFVDGRTHLSFGFGKYCCFSQEKQLHRLPLCKLPYPNRLEGREIIVPSNYFFFLKSLDNKILFIAKDFKNRAEGSKPLFSKLKLRQDIELSEIVASRYFVFFVFKNGMIYFSLVRGLGELDTPKLIFSIQSIKYNPLSAFGEKIMNNEEYADIKIIHRGFE